MPTNTNRSHHLDGQRLLAAVTVELAGSEGLLAAVAVELTGSNGLLAGVHFVATLCFNEEGLVVALALELAESQGLREGRLHVATVARVPPPGQLHNDSPHLQTVVGLAESHQRRNKSAG